MVETNLNRDEIEMIIKILNKKKSQYEWVLNKTAAPNADELETNIRKLRIIIDKLEMI